MRFPAQLRHPHRDPYSPLHVDSRRRSNVSNAQIPLKKPSSIVRAGEARRVLEKRWKGCLGGGWAAIPGAMRAAFPEAY